MIRLFLTVALTWLTFSFADVKTGNPQADALSFRAWMVAYILSAVIIFIIRYNTKLSFGLNLLYFFSPINEDIDNAEKSDILKPEKPK